MDEDGQLVGRETHDQLDDVQGVRRTRRRTYLVASTDIETILEFEDD
jgi:hypothetical protein